jgi:hypothetical protein
MGSVYISTTRSKSVSRQSYQPLRLARPISGLKALTRRTAGTELY